MHIPFENSFLCISWYCHERTHIKITFTLQVGKCKRDNIWYRIGTCLLFPGMNGFYQIWPLPRSLYDSLTLTKRLNHDVFFMDEEMLYANLKRPTVRFVCLLLRRIIASSRAFIIQDFKLFTSVFEIVW